MKRYLPLMLMFAILLSIGFGTVNDHPFFEQLTRRLEKRQAEIPEEKMYIHTDRPFYTVGDDIWFKAYLAEGVTHEFSQLSEIMYVELFTPKGSLYQRLRLPVDMGISQGDFHLGRDEPGGLYTLVAYTNWMKNAGKETYFRKKIQVQKVVLPRLLMKMDFQQKAYGGGDSVKIDVSLRDLQDQPIANFNFSGTVRLWGREVRKLEGRTNREGKAVVSFALPKLLNTRDGLVNFTFRYEGEIESLSRSIPIVLNNIALQFFPEGGNLLAGVAGNLAFKALNEFGKAADVEGVIYDEEDHQVQTFKSYHMGMGNTVFTPEVGKKYYAKLTAPIKSSKRYQLPIAKENGYLLQVNNQTEKEVNLRMYTSQAEELRIVAQMRGKIYYTKAIEAKKGVHSLSVPLYMFPTGIAQITLFNATGIPQCERLVFVNAHREIKVTLNTDKQEYAPREKVKLRIKTTDQDDKPVPTNLSLAVVDDKLLSFADDKQHTILSWLLMGSELRGEIEEPHFYFKKEEEKAQKGLDLVMMIHGWRGFEWARLTDAKNSAYFFAEKGAQIRGQLRSRGGRAVVGTVFLVENYQNGRIEKVETDAEGYFVFEGFSEEHELVVLATVPNVGINDFYIQTNVIQKNSSNSASIGQANRTEVVPEILRRGVRDTGVGGEIGQISLNESSTRLEGVVVTALGIERSYQGLAYAVSSYELTEAGEGRQVNGKAAGVEIQPDISNSALNIRGLSRTTHNEQPIYTLNGQALLNSSAENRGNLNFLESTNIEELHVIKGMSPLDGSQGVNGAVHVITKVPIVRHRNKFHKRQNYRAQNVTIYNKLSPIRKFYVPAYTSKKEVKQRFDFRKTIFWDPDVQTDENGEATISYFNSDATTVFRITAEGMGINGQIARKEVTYHSMLPFSIDTKIPPYLTFDDQMELMVNLKNNTNKTIKGRLLINASKHLESSQDRIMKVSLAPQQTTTIPLAFEVQRITGTGSLGLSFVSSQHRDAIVRELEIEPKGFPVELSFSGDELKKQADFELKDMMPGSAKASFQAQFSIIGHLLDGLSNIFRAPYGCFEQTSSSTYPNILALNCLQTDQKEQPEIEKQALQYIDQGYKRLVGFECKGGGYDWFGRGPASVWLTAYGIMEFEDMKAVYDGVDDEMLIRTRSWLAKQVNRKGRYYKSRKNSYRHDTHYSKVIHAYVVFALASTGQKNMEKVYAIARDDAFLTDDAYLLGLAANAAYDLGKYEDGDRLLQKFYAQYDRLGLGKLKAKRSVTYGYGHSLQMQVTALAILANLKAKVVNKTYLEGLISYILKNKKFGGYGDTQATVLSLKALVAYANHTTMLPEKGELNIELDHKQLALVKYAASESKQIEINDLGANFENGKHQLSINYQDTDKAWPYSMNVSYTTYTPTSSENCSVDLVTTLASNQSALGETVRLSTSIQNTTTNQLGMVVALVGIPSGLSPQPWQLKELQEQYQFDYYEIHKNYVVFYYTTMKPSEKKEIHLDLKAEVPGTYQAPASTAYLYYTNEFKDWEAGTTITVTKE